MILDIESMLSSMVTDQFTVSHLEKKVEAKVIPIAKINSKLKKVIQDEYDAKLIKDADYLIACYEIEATQPEEQDSAEVKPQDDVEEIKQDSSEEGGENKETDNAEADNAEAGVEDGQESSENKPEDEDEEKKKKEVNESVKIEDLTKSMLSTPKIKTISCKCGATPKMVKKGEKPSKKSKTEENGVEDLEEAETSATGDQLRGKVSNALNTLFESQITDSNKLELYDIKSTKENCYFCKLTIKSRDAQTEES